jgi:hypothetical protein
MAELPRSDVTSRSPQAAPARDDPGSGYSMYAEEGFSGWAWFTAVVIGLVGLFQIIAGTVALAGSAHYAVPSRDLIIDVGYTTWGWVHLILGFVMVVTAGGLAFGSTIARIVGVALAALSAVVNLAFIPASPFVATLIIGLNVFLIYAITVHGGEPKQLR